MTVRVFQPLRNWPFALASGLFLFGLSFVWGWHQGQQQLQAEQLSPMTQELGELQALLNTQQQARVRQLNAIQTQLAQQQLDSVQTTTVLSALEQELTRLNADYQQLLASYTLLEHQLAEREILIRQWLANVPQPNP